MHSSLPQDLTKNLHGIHHAGVIVHLNAIALVRAELIVQIKLPIIQIFSIHETFPIIPKKTDESI